MPGVTIFPIDKIDPSWYTDNKDPIDLEPIDVLVVAFKGQVQDYQVAARYYESIQSFIYVIPEGELVFGPVPLACVYTIQADLMWGKIDRLRSR